MLEEKKSERMKLKFIENCGQEGHRNNKAEITTHLNKKPAVEDCGNNVKFV